MTVTAAATLRLASFVTTALCAAAEKPRPPYDSGMIMPKNRFSLMKRQASEERSCAFSTSHSSIMVHSVWTGPSRNARSFSDNGRGSNSRSLRHAGSPEKSSPSHQTVPASSAVRSVSLMRGSTRDTTRMSRALIVRVRRAGTPNTRDSDATMRPTSVANARIHMGYAFRPYLNVGTQDLETLARKSHPNGIRYFLELSSDVANRCSGTSEGGRGKGRLVNRPILWRHRREVHRSDQCGDRREKIF